MRRLSPATLALIALAVIVLVGLIYVYATRDRGNPDALGDSDLAARDGSTPAERCASKATYDAIKRELFRQAAETRGSDQAAFDRLAAYAVLRVDQPVVKADDGDVGLRCSGRLSLDLPPGLAVVGGRRTLSAQVDYVIHSAADNSGDVVILDGAEGIIVPLATLARIAAPAPSPPVTEPAGPASELPPDLGSPPPGMPAPAIPPAQSPAVEPFRPSASPSFNCRNARTRGEIAVCSDSGLAALDRQMAGQFSRALGAATPIQRTLLQRTRASFLIFRDQCPSNACIAETYRGRMREISDIMAGRWRPPR